MFLLSKILTPFILVPGLFLFFLAALFICLYKKKYKILKYILISLTVFFYLCSIQPVGDLFLAPLEKAYPAYDWQGTHDAKYIVLLGGGTIESSPAEKNESTLAPDSMNRMLYAFRLHQKTGLPIICSGGIVFREKTARSEAEIFASLLEELGMNPHSILLEKQSRNTWENAREVQKLYQPGKILLVTSAFHIARSVLCFENNGMEVVPAPSDYKINNGAYNFFSFLPRAVNQFNIALSIHEYIGLIIYGISYFR
ncbi:MAG: YdcF family protein [Spirochaetales bacterium]|nr:YdcF family protein [Spirochaetales bacterium]